MTHERIHIHHGHIIDPASGVDAPGDLYIADGKIVSLNTAPDGFSADTEIDASNKIVCPGFIDLSARLREPGQEHKGTIASETRAAARSGITTLCCPPDTLPVIDTPAVADLIQNQARKAGYARVLPIGALTYRLQGDQLSEMAALKDAGCVGVGNALQPLLNTLVQRRSMEYAATHDLTVFLHSEDPSLRDAGTVHEGPVSARLGIPGIPEAAETVAVARDLALVACTGVRAHFCRLSTAHAIKMVARAQFDGLPVSADVSAHQLFLTDEDVATFDSNCHFRPPLRSSEDRDALRQGLCNGSIAAICSDHQPHENDAKEAPFPATEPGASTLETLLPLALRLQQSNTLGLSDVIALLTSGPGRIIGSSFGTLTPGSSADVCIFDPDYRWQLNEDTMLSRGHNTPFLNQEMIGLVTHTLLSGHLVYTHGG